MSEADISPLAKRLAEENNVDWRKLRGSGADGKVVERDVLEYLARVMSGQEDMDPTPEPLPEGMEEWPEEDIAAYRRGARDRSQAETQAGAAAAADAPEAEDEIDEDIFLFEDEDTDEVSEAEEQTAETDVFAVAGAEEIVEEDDLFLDLDSDTSEAETPRPTAAGSLDWRDELSEPEEEEPETAEGSGFDSMAFDLEEPEPPQSGGAAVERADVRDLEFVAEAAGAAEDAPSEEVAAEEEPLYEESAGGALFEEPTFEEPTFEEPPVEEPPVDERRREDRRREDRRFEAPRPQVAAVSSDLPLVSYGHLLRRHLDLTAVHNAQAALGRELGLDEPLGLSVFLLRAAAKALRTHPLGSGGPVLAKLDGGLGFVSVSDPGSRPFREVSDAVGEPPSAEELPDGTSLVVADLSDLEIDEAVLNLGAPVLALGRVLYDDEAGDVRGTLSLSGEVDPEAGGKILAAVADLLAAPVRLLV